MQTIWIYQRVMRPKDAAGMTNSVDPDQTLMWVYTDCPGMSVRKFRIITGISILVKLRTIETHAS